MVSRVTYRLIGNYLSHFQELIVRTIEIGMLMSLESKTVAQTVRIICAKSFLVEQFSVQGLVIGSHRTIHF